LFESGTAVSRSTEDSGFACAHCGELVGSHPAGSYRNHCSACLHSLHVDVLPGDRAAECGGEMKPIALDYSGKKGFILVHECLSCGQIDRNKTAPDDDPEALRGVRPPFPPVR